jgi:hypothetical protein
MIANNVYGGSGGTSFEFDYTDITAYFDVSSIDLNNNVWNNTILSGVNMDITGTYSIEDGGVKLNGGAYGLCSCGEPDVIYVVLKKPTNDNDMCLFGRARNSNTSGYDMSLWSETTAGANMLLSCSEMPYVNLNVDTDYHVFAVVFSSNVNTDNTNMVSIYMDGKLMGIRPNTSHGRSYGISINARKAGTDVARPCTSPTYFKAVACGTKVDSDTIYKNSMYLLNTCVG